MKRKALYGVIAVALCATQAAWAELPRYMITDLGELKPEVVADVVATSINNKNTIIGFSPISVTYDSANTAYHDYQSFIYSKGKMKGAGLYNGYQLSYSELNNKNIIFGGYWEGSNINYVLIKNGAVKPYPIDTTKFPAHSSFSSVALNDKNQVAITLSGSSPYIPFPQRGVIVDTNKNVFNVPFAPRALNNRSQVVGVNYKSTSQGEQPRAYRYNFKTKKLINLLGRNNYGYAHDINDAGQVVGARYVPGPEQNRILQAYLHDGKKVINIGALPSWMESESFATAINNKGQVVGSSNTNEMFEEGSKYHAFVYDKTNGIRDLNDLIVNKAGWDFINKANDINDKGKIVGTAISWRGILSRAVLLTPVGPAVNVSDAVAIQVSDVSLLPSRSVCPINYAAEGTFKVRLTNNGTQTLTALELDFAQSTNIQFLVHGNFYKVDELLGISTLDNNRYRDGKLSPGESIKVSFTACLKENKPFTVAANNVWAAKTK